MIDDTEITILIIDDRPNNLRFLSQILSQAGYKVKRAISGELGLNSAIIIQPDLILLDILMPEMDGYKVCKLLKNNPKTQGIPVIFLSALSEVSDKVKGFQVGGVDYITKPFKAEEVLARIENQITIKKLHLQLEKQNKQLQREIDIRKNTENNLSTIITNMSEGLMIIDGEGKIVFVNPSTELLWEKSAKKLIGEEIGLPLIDSNQTEIYIRQKSGKVLFLETRIGEIIWENKTAYLLTLKDVTARRQEQEYLKLLQRAIETTPQGITISDVSKDNQPLLYVNSGFEKITGYSNSEVIGRNCNFLQAGEDREQPEVAKIRQAIAKGKNCQVVLQNTRKDGSKFWNELTISPVHDSYGNLTHYVGVQADISDRIAAEESLRESESRFRSMADSTTVMIRVTDSESNCTFFNKSWLEFTGYNLSEALERGWLESVHQEDRTSCQQTYARSQKTRENFQIEYRLCRFDGEERWVLDTGRPRFTPNGTFAGYISAAIDITDRKATETQLRLVNERLKFLLVSSPAIIYSCKVTGDYGLTWVSDNITLLTDYQPRDFTENSRFWLNHIHPDDVGKVSAEISKLLDSGYLCNEYRFLHNNGSYVWFHDELKVVYDNLGNPIEAVGYWLDITERKQAEIELSRAKISLERQIQRALVLGKITDNIRSSLEPEQVYQTAANQIGKALKVDRCLIHTYVEFPIPRIPLVAHYQSIRPELDRSIEIPVIGNPYTELILSQERAVATDDVTAEPRLEPVKSTYNELNMKSMAAVRTSYQGQVNGIIGIHQCSHIRHWKVEDIELLEAVAAQVGIAIAQLNLLTQEQQQRQELTKQNQLLQQEIQIRKQVEDSLKKSEERWQLVLQGNNEGIYDWNIKTNEAFLSPRLKAILGYEEHEITSHIDEFYNRIHPEDRDRVMNLLQNYLHKKLSHYSVEYRTSCKNSSYKWVSAKGQALWDRDGNPVRMVGSQQDISDRKQMEEALKESETRYRELVESQDSVLVCRWKSDGTLTFVNQYYCRFFGKSSAELLGTNFFKLSPDEQTQKLLQNHIKSTKNNLCPATLEDRVISATGEQRWLSWTNQLIVDRNQQLIEFQSFGIDITDQKQREQALHLIVEGIAAHTGEDFFNACVRSLAQVVQVRYACISELKDSEDRIHVRAFWTGYDCKVNFNYSVANTPCEKVLDGEICYYSKSAQQLFPKDSWLTQLEVESYWGIPLYSSQGKITGVLTVMDVSPMNLNSSQDLILKIFAARVGAELERLQAEEQLKGSQQRLSFLLQNTPVAVIEWNTEWEVIAWNQTAELIFGYTAREIIGRKGLELIVSPQNHSQVETITEMPQGSSYRIDQNLTKAGKTIICEWYDTPLVNPEGIIIGFASIAIDITERKQQELLQNAQNTVLKMVAQGRSLHEVLLELTTQIDELLPNLQSAIMWMEANGQYLRPFVAPNVPQVWLEAIDPIPVENSCFSSTAVYFRQRVIIEDIVNDPLCETYQEAALLSGLHSCWSEPILSSGEDRVLGTFMMCFGNKRSPEKKELEILESLARLTALIIEHKQAEIELKNAKEAAEAANHAKSNFLASMTHELRTPLNAILGFSQMLVRDNSLNGEQIEQLEIINRSGDHLLNLINDILSMSKIEAGRVTLTENCFNLHQLLQSLKDMLMLKANQKCLQLIFEVPDDLPEIIKSDEGKLRQILINILGNAVKFTSKGKVILSVSNNQQSGKIKFAITDTGPGIDASEIDYLFEPFVQTKTGQKSVEGTGLGLPISREFVRLMGGDIFVSSQVGKGTTFTFDILAEAIETLETEILPNQKRIIGLETDRPTYRILVVEDVKENSQLLIHLLKPLGFQLENAENGKEAISIWQNWQPHLIFMDIIMPVMDGYEATKIIKQSSDGQGTIIIALTANAFDEDRDAILAAGCDDFIAKPFSESLLLEKLASHLGVRYLYQEQLSNSGVVKPSIELTKEALSIMPTEWLEKLHFAVLSVNDKIVNELIQQIPETEITLINCLTNLVENFRLDVILELIEREE